MDLEARLRKLEAHVRSRAYSGYSKFDALNSPFLEALFGSTYVSRLLITQFVNRVPLPLRSLLGVRRSRNPKGIANFIRGYCRWNPSVPGIGARDAVRDLADWLLENHSARYGRYEGPGLAWGYNFPWQSPGFFAPRHSPNCIVTVFAAEALLDAYEFLGERRYLDGAVAASRFVLEALPVLEETRESKCIGYVTSGLRWKVININAVAAGFLSRLSAVAEGNYLDEARRMVRWVRGVQQADHSWNYTEPRSQSGIGPDNYHTGGILDGLFDFVIRSGDDSVKETWEKGMEFYLERFFDADGAPRWRVDRAYPRDIHGAAQGIISFSRGAVFRPEWLEAAHRILQWTCTHLQAPSGGFHYQKRRGYTWKLELMRWNNSWMFWAMAEYRKAAEAAVAGRKVGS